MRGSGLALRGIAGHIPTELEVNAGLSEVEVEVDKIMWGATFLTAAAMYLFRLGSARLGSASFSPLVAKMLITTMYLTSSYLQCPRENTPELIPISYIMFGTSRN